MQNQTAIIDNHDLPIQDTIRQARTPHATIAIYDNEDFSTLGFPGNGTESNPYLIEDFFITHESRTLIHIEDTTAYFVIRNCELDAIRGSTWGIRMRNVSHGMILDNIVYNTVRAICLEGGYDNLFSNNTLRDNSNYGILLGGYNNTIIGNKIYNTNTDGIWGGGRDNIIMNNIIHDNTRAGIFYYTARDNTIQNNTIYNNEYGIYVYYSDNSTISDNQIYNNSIYGVPLYYSNQNVLFKNTIVNNPQHGAFIHDSSTLNTFVWNNFTGNGINAEDDGVNNQWDNGSHGNYWNDYPGVDLNDDGIGDTPYSISGSAGNQDNYPIWDDGYELLPPLPIAPENGAKLYYKSVTFEWSLVPGAQYYRLQLDDNPEFLSPDLFMFLGSSTSQQFNNLNEGTHYWRMCTENIYGDWSEWSDAWNFTIDIMLPPPLLIAPESGVKLYYKSVTFEWSLVPGAQYYRLQLDDNPEFLSPEMFMFLGSSTSQQFNNLNEGTHYWRMCTENTYGDWSDWSDAWNFTIDTVLSPPFLIAPESGIELAVREVTVEWSLVPGAQAYWLQVDDDINFLSIDWYTELPASSTTQLVELFDDGTYYWRMCTQNIYDVWGEWSNPWNFTINTSLPPPLLIAPENGGEFDNKTISFEWSSVPGANYYRLQIDDNDDFSSPSVNTRVSAPSTTQAVEFYYEGTYYWRMCSIIYWNDLNEWSEVRNFTVDTTPPPVNEAPVVDAGSDQLVDEGKLIYFSGSFTDEDITDTHTIEWNFGDGNFAYGTLTPTHTYEDNGVYTVILTITDDNSVGDPNGPLNGSDILEVSVSNIAPLVEIGPDLIVEEYEFINFNATVSDSGNDTFTFEWDFTNDGIPDSTLENPIHAYSTVGTYTVLLVVTDDDGGIGTDTLEITVTPGYGPEADTDNDGLTNGEETDQWGTNPFDPDTDNDELPDGQELEYWQGRGVDPTIYLIDPDSDNDGWLDGVEIRNRWDPLDPLDPPYSGDPDEDGLSTSEELEIWHTDPFDSDSDDDEIPDGQEVNYWQRRGVDPLDDEDGDQIVNLHDPDSDNDLWLDGVEIRFNTDPLDPNDPALDVDSDRDGLTNSEELLIGTDPLNDDSDRDGLKDGEEVNIWGSDPLSADSDEDGLLDSNEIHPLNDPDNDRLPNIIDPDSDNDGLLDGIEFFSGTNLEDPNSPGMDSDIDRDQLPTELEMQIGTNPFLWDTDGDGLSDRDEYEFYLPFDHDNDNDGIACPLDPDSDNDGILDGREVEYWMIRRGVDPLDDHDSDRMPNLFDPDSDNDGWLDGDEVFIGWDPLNPHSPDDDALSGDHDNDGLSLGEEYQIGTDPFAWDTDGDGLSDGEEYLNLGSDPRESDTDRDGLTDGDEAYLFNPLGDPDEDFKPNIVDPDSDNDGWLDGIEFEMGWDPLDPNSPDNGEDPDGDSLTSEEEIQIGTDPLDWDTDGDGISDGDEYLYYWIDHDNDGDGLLCFLDPDSDNDGLNDGHEMGYWVSRGIDPIIDDMDGDYKPNLFDSDSDNDGLFDGFEVLNGFDPQNPDDPDLSGDSDGDGISDEDELHYYGTDPFNKDTDGDLLSDSEELLEFGGWGTDPRDPDFDDDGLLDYQEILYWQSRGEDPMSDPDHDFTPNLYDRDSDNDGISDGLEAFYGFDPTSPFDPDPQGDEDDDGLTNQEELLLGLGFMDWDSDGDGLSDGDELNVWNTDPLNGVDTYTPIGSDVVITDLNTGITLEFDEISNPGVTTIVESTIGPDPREGYEQVLRFSIDTTATSSGTITMSIPYDDSEVYREDELRLFYWNPDSEHWEDITLWVDTVLNILHGEVTHFSNFSLMKRVDFRPPETELIITDCFVDEHDIIHVTENSTFLFIAIDDLSGVANTFYRINGGSWIKFVDVFNLTGPNGNFTIDYYSIDAIGNIEAINSTLVIFDEKMGEEFQGFGMLRIDGDRYCGQATMTITEEEIIMELEDQIVTWDIVNQCEFGSLEFIYGEGDLGSIRIIIFRGESSSYMLAFGTGVFFCGQA